MDASLDETYPEPSFPLTFFISTISIIFLRCFHVSVNVGTMIFGKMRLFQKTATGVLFIFMGLMLLVTIVAYSRTSGSTRQDMSQAHFIRQQVDIKQQADAVVENP
ncbi:MAG: hypothetical protein WCF65_02540 [Parachlamydiaceae bacterium]